MADLSRLSQKQRAERDILMFAFDTALAERHQYDIIDANGHYVPGVDVNSYTDGELTREEYEQVIVDALQSGYSIGGTFRESLQQLSGMNTVDLSGEELESLPGSVNDDNNAKLDDMIITLYHEYAVYGATPVVPFDEQDGKFNAESYGLTFSAEDYDSATLYTVDENGVSYMRPLQSTPDKSVVYFNGSNEELSSNFEALLATKTVLAANEFVREYNRGGKDEPMTLIQAIELRDAIRLDMSDYDTPEEARQAIVEKTEDYLVARGIISSGPDSSFSDYIQNGYGIATPDEVSDLAYEAVNVTGSNLRVVDVFGKKNLHGVDVPVAQMDTVHAFINSNRAEQLRSVDGVGEGSFSADVADRNSDVRYTQKRVSPTTYLVENDTHMFMTDGESIIHPADLAEDAQYPSLEEGQFAGNAVGLSETTNDMLGVSRLRRFVKTDDYSVLNVEMPKDTTYFDAEVQRKSVDNAVAILEMLDSKGIQYSIKPDEKPTQLKASCPELGIDIRIMDVEEPHFVSRCYGDNLQTYYSVDIPMTMTMEGGKRKNVWDDVAERNLASSEQIIRTGEASLAYMPTPQQAVDLVRYRLGENVEISAGIGVPGTRYLGAPGPAIRTSVPPRANGRVSNTDEIARSTTGASYGSSSNAIAQYSTEQFYFKSSTGGMLQKTVPVRISTSTAGRDNVTAYKTDEAFAALEEYMLEARANFSDQVFGDMKAEISKAVPNYEKDNWTSYRKTPKTEEEKTWARDEEGYLLHPETNERIVWRQSSRSDELKQAAGQSLADMSEIQISHDPAVKALQENYIAYIEHDDAYLLGVVDGKVVPETIDELNRRIAIDKEMADTDVDESVQALFEVGS